jgi:putative adhesin
MRTLVARIALPAVLVPALVAAGGCDIAMADLKSKESAEWHKTYQLQAGGTVEIANVNGRIAVEPSSGQTVDIVAMKTARAASPEGARDALSRTEIREDVSPTRVRIETKHQRSGAWFASNNVEVAYTVKVPAGADVRFSTVNGGIELAGLGGRIKAETVNGGIVARQVSGAFDASTVNGGVDVDVEALAADGLTLGCTNGGIKLRLPRDARANIRANVVNGGIDAAGLNLDASEQSRRRLEARLNGGGPRISIDGTNGGIRIASR